MKEPAKLTEENYYQDQTWLSNSRMKTYLQCEAKGVAIDKGEWVETRDDTPLIFGNFVHSFFESPEAHADFVEANRRKIFKKNGGPYAAFETASKVINCLDSDEIFNTLYHGHASDEVKKEMIITGTINGVPVKGKVDSINLTRGYFVDLKTMKSIYAREWNAELHKKVPTAANNILGFGYHGQLALYQELLKQMTGKNFRPVIVAVSKEAVPDKEVLKIDEEWLAEGLEAITENIVHVWNLVQGKIEPKKCGHCDYCRSQKKLGRVVSLSELLEME